MTIIVITKMRQMLYTVAVAAMILLFILSSTDLILQEKENKIYNIAIILDDVSDVDFAIFKKGVDQSYRERAFDVTYITLKKKSNFEEQRALINTEIENGVDGIILFAVEPKDMISEENPRILYENLSSSVPIVYIGAETSFSDNYVSNNSYDSGEALGDYILEETKNSAFTTGGVYTFSSTPEQISAYNAEFGLKNVFSKNNIDVFTNRYDNTVSLNTRLDKIFLETENSRPVIIALDLETLRYVAQYLEHQGLTNQFVYGIGGTNDVVGYLRSDVIKAVSINNTYNTGYLCTKRVISLVEKKVYHKKDEPITIDHYVISKDRLFDKSYEKFLFPIN